MQCEDPQNTAKYPGREGLPVSVMTHGKGCGIKVHRKHERECKHDKVDRDSVRERDPQILQGLWEDDSRRDFSERNC